MTFVVLGAILGGIIGGLFMRSIFGGIAFTILLLLFFVMWRYFRDIGKNVEVGDTVVDEEESTPPVSVNNIPSQQSVENSQPYNQPPQEPTYPQDTQKGI